MKADNHSKSKQKAKSVLTRRGIILISVLAVLILIVNIVTASFSWFAPNTVYNPSTMQYSELTYNRSENCTFKTCQGTIITQDLYNSVNVEGGAYYNNPAYTDYKGKKIDDIIYSASSINSITVSGGSIVYLRTYVQNDQNESYASDVSFYFASFGQAGSDLTVAVTFPSNTVRNVNGAQTDFCLFRNAYVKAYDANDADPGLLQVDWFVKNNGTSSVTINLKPESESSGNTYLMYN